MSNMDDTSLIILNSAKYLFSKKGFHSVTTKEISDHANVNEVTLFRKFSTKENLYNKVFELFDSSFEEKVIQLENQKDIKMYLLNLGNIIYDMFITNIDILAIEIKNVSLKEELDLPLKKYSKVFFTQIVMKLLELLKIDKNRAELKASVFLTSIFGYFIQTNLIKDKYFRVDYNLFLEELNNLILK